MGNNANAVLTQDCDTLVLHDSALGNTQAVEAHNLDPQAHPYIQERIDGKQDTISDLSTIRSGAASGATALQPSDVINAVNSTDTNKPLSANMGKELNDRIDNISARGRFLALWNCATGLAETQPATSPYAYHAGDYFIVGTVAAASGTNYAPSGSSYTTGVPSTAVETSAVDSGDCYYYDGTTWKLQVNTQKELGFRNIAGDPYDNTNLAGALNDKQDTISDLSAIRSGAAAGATAVQPADLQTELANKQDTLVSGTNIKTVNNNSLVGSGNIDIESLPSQTGQSGKFLTTDGTSASWGTPPQGLKNTATGTDSLTLLGTATASTNAINIGTGSQTSGRRGVALGYRALASAQDAVAIGPGSESVTSVRTQATAQNAVAIGGNASASGERSVALGFNAGVSNTNTYGGIALGTGARIDDGGTGAIQIGTGHNGTPYTLSIGLGSNNYLLLQANGKIPAARLPSMAPTLTWYTGNTGTTVTIANTSSAALVKVYKNGVLLQPTQDYSISGTTLTLVTALVSTDKITTEVF